MVRGVVLLLYRVTNLYVCPSGRDSAFYVAVTLLDVDHVMAPPPTYCWEVKGQTCGGWQLSTGLKPVQLCTAHVYNAGLHGFALQYMT